jgi:hypothetical protein
MLATESAVVLKTILKQREVLYQYHKSYGIGRIELELIAVSVKQPLFSLYDLQKHYPHTNIQQLRRCIKKLRELKYVETFKLGYRNSPTLYIFSKSAKGLLNDYLSKMTD